MLEEEGVGVVEGEVDDVEGVGVVVVEDEVDDVEGVGVVEGVEHDAVDGDGDCGKVGVDERDGDVGVGDECVGVGETDVDERFRKGTAAT